MSRKNKNDYLDYLAAVPLFSVCDRSELKAIAAHATLLSVGSGRTLIREGDRGREAFIIVEGAAEVVRQGVVVDKLGPGAFFGELSLLDPAPRDATVTATDELEALVLGENEFTGLLAEVPSLTRSLLAGMARRLREYDLRALPKTQ